MPVIDPQALIENRVTAIRDYHHRYAVDRAEIDVSGGVDSAVMVMLLARALGPDNVTAVHSRINTDPDATARAHEVCEVAGVTLIDIGLDEIYSDILTAMKSALTAAGFEGVEELIDGDPTVTGSIRSTLRAPIGRGFNRLAGGGVRHGTGNECEDRWLRFYQKGGDGEVDTNPIAMLSKGEVFQLALALGCPVSILTASPDHDLWAGDEGSQDENEIATYLRLGPGASNHTFYSYIDLDTGEYRSVGLVERVSRFLDTTLNDGLLDTPVGPVTVEEYLFNDDEPDPATLIRAAMSSGVFQGVEADLIGQLLFAARRVEAITRHKFNPACPTLGDRQTLVDNGVLTDTLPSV